MNTQKIKYGLLHCHTEYSRYDSALKVAELIKIAIELGAPAVTLTDHGTLMGVDDFMTVTKEMGIKGIPGVEAYIREDDGLPNRQHLILLPKDDIGYQAISKAVTASNRRIQKTRFGEYPCMNLDILKLYFGNGSKGHGHVIATSACMAGVLASVLLSNNELEKEISKVTKKMSLLQSPNDASYHKNKKRLDELEVILKEGVDERNRLKKLSETKFKKREQAVEALQGTEAYEEKKEKLELDKKAAEEAGKKLQLVKQAIMKAKKDSATLKKQLKIAEEQNEKYMSLVVQKGELEAKKMSPEALYEETKKVANQYIEIFGAGNFYIELQYHGLAEEADCMPKLANIAKNLNIPVVAANDVHIGRKSEDEFRARQIMKSLPLLPKNMISEMSDSDKELYIKTDQELERALLQILDLETVKEAIKNIGAIVNECNVEFTHESHYPKYISEIPGETADEAITRMAYEGIEWRFPGKKGWDEEHQNRLERELNVIKGMGYSDYHCIVKDFLEYGRLLGKLPKEKIEEAPFDKTELKEYLDRNGYDVGQGIGPGRGSAVGSEVCYLLGITAMDPLKYDLLFERFLNLERVSMPDIDSDFSPEIRNKVISYVCNKYGVDAVTCIVTKGTQAAKGAIRNCARFIGMERYKDKVALLSLGDTIAKEIPNELNIKLASCVDSYWKDDNGNRYENGTQPDGCRYMPGLYEKFKGNSDAEEIIHNALLVEGTMTQYGMHAAGVIISDGKPVSDYVPLMWDDKNETWKTQCDMVQAESQHGLLKMDFLGLRNLAIITEAVKRIKKRKGICLDVERLPMEPVVFEKIFATGNTNSVFQFESPGMKKMLLQFKPTCFEDIILLVAAYRPGPMQYLPKIIAVKNGREDISYMLPELEPILNKTYGSIIYQEQVMQIFQSLAGYSLGQADIVRRYMSKKKMEKLAHEREAFVNGDKERNIVGCVRNGISPDKANQLFDEMTDFAKYAFNKSHAAAYALVSYITAYLKYFYPVEYLTAALNYSPIDKIPGLMSDCKKMGIKVLAPDINLSSNEFTPVEDAIMCGLGGIKNVGDGASEILAERYRNGDFVSLKDFLLRCNADKKIKESLVGAGAMDCFSNNRVAMKCILNDASDIAKKIKEKQNILDDLVKNVPDEKSAEKVKKAYQKKLDNTRKSLEQLKESFAMAIIPTNIAEDKKNRLDIEKELLGFYISGSPLDEYPTGKELGCEDISELDIGKNISVMGLISNMRKTTRKKDGMPMAFFTIEDQSGSIDCCCFTKAYAEYGEYCIDGDVVKITGDVIEDDTDDEQTALKFSIEKISSINKKMPPIMIQVNSIMDWVESIQPMVEPYYDSDGHVLLIHDKMSNEVRECTHHVRKDIMYNLGLEAVLLE